MNRRYRFAQGPSLRDCYVGYSPVRHDPMLRWVTFFGILAGVAAGLL